MTGPPQPPPPPFVVTIDGNIGAGKTTVLECLSNVHGAPVVVEPIDLWQPFLQRLYAGEPGAAFAMQVRVWFDRAGGGLHIPPSSSNHAPVFVERSPLMQVRAFVEAQRGNLAPHEVGLLQEMYAQHWVPSVHVYLRSSPEACAQRVARRARPGEALIDAGYLAALHALHESAFRDLHSVAVVDVDGKTPLQIAAEIMSAASAAATKKKY